MEYNIENTETQELILKFLKGELSNKDRKAFLLAMKGDQVLAKEVAFNEAILLHNKHSETVNRKSVLVGIAKSTAILPNLDVDISEFDAPNSLNTEGTANNTDSRTPPKGSIGKWLGGLFIVGAGLITLLWFTMPDFFYFNKEDLIVAAAKEMIPLKDIFVLPSGEDSPLSEGMSFYKEGKYEEAIKQYRNHLSRNPNDSEVQLFMAVAQLFGGEISASISNLKQLSVIDDPFLSRHSSWYLSLAYLKNKQPSKAKILLEQLKKDELYAAQAQKLLDQI